MQDAASPSSDLLRIFIFASPKTGNNWLSLLLSTVYRIKQIVIPFECDWLPDGNADKTSVRLKDLPYIDCVGHEHLWPNEGMVKMLVRERIHTFTLLRHPADAFLSLYHYVNKEKESPRRGWLPLLKGHRLDDPPVYEFLDKYFFAVFLERAFLWLATGKAIPVRYEDLKFKAKETLTRITRLIRPVDESRIDEAIEFCDIGNMKKLNEDFNILCRKGEVGEWRSVLNQRHIELMMKHGEVLNILGYSLEDSPAAARLDMYIQSLG